MPEPRAPKPSAPAAESSAQQAAELGMRIARNTGKVLGLALGTARRVLGHIATAAANWLVRHRGGVARVGERALWWGALALVAIAGVDLMSGTATESAYARVPWMAFAAFGACAAVCLTTPASHLRKAAFLLGSTSAALGLVAWMSAAA